MFEDETRRCSTCSTRVSRATGSLKLTRQGHAIQWRCCSSATSLLNPPQLLHKLSPHRDVSDTARFLTGVLMILCAGRAALEGSAADREAAGRLLGCVMAEAPRPLLPSVLAVLAELLDCTQHNALGPSDFQIYATPPGTMITSPVSCDMFFNPPLLSCLSGMMLVS